MASETSSAKKPENEEVEVSVLEFQPKFPTWFWIRSILLGIVLVPLRLILIVTISTVFWLSSLVIIYTGTDFSRQLIGINVYLQKWLSTLISLTTRSMGIVTTFEGVESEDARMFVVGPHTTFTDPMIATQAKPTATGVAAEYVRRMPFFGELYNISL